MEIVANQRRLLRDPAYDWQAITGKKMILYLSREEKLCQRHEEIITERVKLLEEMKLHREQQENEKRHLQEEADQALKRNQAILEDLQLVEENLNKVLQSTPHPSLVSLENRYWRSVEEEIPKWELFLLGKTQSPFGTTQKPNSKQTLKHSHTMQTPRKKHLPPSGFNSNTFPR
ncbi:centrosomal protein 15 [Rhinophrynus dorsalis]